MAVAIFTTSREYYLVDIDAAADPTADTVEFAFTPDVDTQPGDADWQPGEWDPAITTSPYTARILLGPGADAVPLTAANYAVWLRITDDPEIPVRHIGILVVI